MGGDKRFQGCERGVKGGGGAGLRAGSDEGRRVDGVRGAMRLSPAEGGSVCSPPWRRVGGFRAPQQATHSSHTNTALYLASSLTFKHQLYEV
jgi:hypothetical protein